MVLKNKYINYGNAKIELKLDSLEEQRHIHNLQKKMELMTII